ncbi:MAG: ATP-binding cassette domain-containing protein, partial [Bacteroidales bacterium]|nr:ATP-binding cassette domain-containing protein [Bacteroidales bacterium]
SSQINAIGNPRLENFHFDQIAHVDQSPIGKTARSTPATYTKIFDSIRQLFAGLPESKKKKYSQSTFSYNTIGGRCEKCEGAGKIETGMHFLGNIEQVCDACNGNRYSDELNLIHYQGKSISEILNLSFNEAYDFFSENAKIQKQLRIVKTIGLGYLKLGQSSNSLSGGEAQRIKLAAELIRGASKNSLYLFNEPSTGLHYYDIQILLNLFSDLLKQGNTLLIIEHNQDIIKNAHRIIDIGPGSNHQGGNLVFSGNFDDFLLQKNSITAQSFSTNLENTFRDETSKTKNKSISFRGIRTHNLKNIHIEIPDNKTTVIIGKSGSGKTSLAFDTIFAESQYRFTESFPNYVRQFTNHFSQAQFDTVSGLTPVIGLRQKNQMNDRRSTLATFVDIYDYYRLLYARFGDYLCPNCGSILNKNSCTKCAFISTQKLSASHFSFNQAEGSCTNCKGLGTVLASAPELWIENPEISISEGAFKKHKSLQFYADPNGQYMAILEKVGQHFEIDYNLPINQLSYQALQYAFFGSGKTIYHVNWNYKRKNRKGNHQFKSEWIGFAQLLLDEYYRKYANGKGQDILPYLVEKECPICLGKRLNEAVLKIKIHGKDISELSGLAVKENIIFFNQLKENKKIDPQLIETILLKLEALQAMKLGYLQLNRTTGSLSGGEYQRTLLATQFTSNLSGITYIIDEPSSGLHPADIPIVLNAFNRLKELGNTIIVTDHHPQIIKSADFLIELGPESGNAGGEIIFSGTKQNHNKIIDSSLLEAQEPLDEFNSLKGNDLFIRKANANNLKNIDVSFKLNAINVVCGVSGSGKTSLLRNVLYQSYKNKNASNCETIQGFSLINDLQWVSARSGILNQQPIASYFGLWDEIRKHFSNQPQAKELGFKPLDFSLNSKANQCPTCKGQGIQVVKLDFLNDVNSLCESCGGSGFTQNILQVKYKGKSISEVLQLTLDEALSLFFSDDVLCKKLALIQKIGLSYLKLNQKLKQLSHGEYQRARLIHQIMNTQLNNTVFVFDEPSKGLSRKDLKYLFELFSLLIKSNSSIIVIEHNPEVIRRADYILELGFGAGKEGGNLIFKGTLTELLKSKSSKTAEYLRSMKI